MSLAFTATLDSMSHQSRWASLKDSKGQNESKGAQRPSPSSAPSGSQQSRWANVAPKQQATAPAQQQEGVLRGLAPPTGLSARNTAKPLGGKALDRMALLASPSRGLDASSSLSADLLAQGSMDLTDPGVQAEFRAYISTQIASRVIPALVSSKAPKLSVLESATYLPVPRNKAAPKAATKAEEELQQVVLLARKLREAVVASKRTDAFVVEVYRLSAQLALLCMDVPQLSTSLPRLVLDLLPLADSDATSPDIASILKHVDAPFDTQTSPAGKTSTASLLLLQTLCLSGKATRLGQYSNGATAQSTSLQSSTASLREYRLQRAQLASVYPENDAHFKLCDQVYAVLRDSNPFLLASLLERPQLDIWQRILLMQLVPTVRTRAWAIARKAYMYLPISAALSLKLNPQLTLTSESSTESTLLESLLLLSTTYLPSTSDAVQKSSKAKSQVAQPPPPDDWDEDDPTAQLTEQLARTKLQHGASPIIEARIADFLELEFSSAGDLAQRVMQIREGHAFKIR